MGISLAKATALLPLLLLVQCAVVAATLAHKGDLCLYSCQNTLKNVQFNDTGPAAAKLAQPCTSQMSLKSMYLCMDLNCDVVARDKGFQMLSETCRANEGVDIPPLSIVGGYTKEDIDGFRRVNWTDTYGPGDQFNEIVLPSEEFFEGWLGTLVRRHYEAAVLILVC